MNMRFSKVLTGLGLALVVGSAALSQGFGPAALWQDMPAAEKASRVSELVEARRRYVETLKNDNVAANRQFARAYERCFSKHDFAADMLGIVAAIDSYYQSPANACRDYSNQINHHIAGVCRSYLSALMKEEQEYNLIISPPTYAPCP